MVLSGASKLANYTDLKKQKLSINRAMFLLFHINPSKLNINYLPMVNNQVYLRIDKYQGVNRTLKKEETFSCIPEIMIF